MRDESGVKHVNMPTAPTKFKSSCDSKNPGPNNNGSFIVQAGFSNPGFIPKPLKS
jgi:hypothetical protein